MRRPEFTPRTWYSKDKTVMYCMDRYGMTDILPGPNGSLFKWIEANYGKKPFDPRQAFQSGDAHIHWAQRPEQQD
jgi:hypothetical protein